MDDQPTADLADCHFPATAIAGLEAWSDYDTFDNLLDMRDGPFNEYGRNRYFEREGKSWVRFGLVMTDAFVDIEIRPSGWMGEIRPVAAEEAYRESKLTNKA